MSSHLSSLQISECLMGGAAPAVEKHASDCFECGAEVAFLGAALARFRRNVIDWSAQIDRQEYQIVRQMTPARTAYGAPRLAGVSSLLIHSALACAMVLAGTFHPVQNLVKRQLTAIEIDLRPYIAQQKTRSAGGGGGGARESAEASRGKMPKPAPRPFTPPRADPVEAKLQIPASIIVPPDVPNLQAGNFGDPLSKLGIPSNGGGFGGGIGTGGGGGLGPGIGKGFGSGVDGGIGGGFYHIGGGISAPTVLYKVEPEYSEEARKAKWQGTVRLSVVVDEAGHPRSVSVLRSLGLGLDQKAIEAVSQWRFRPGLKDGKPVPVIATIDVNFRLL